MAFTARPPERTTFDVNNFYGPGKQNPNYEAEMQQYNQEVKAAMLKGDLSSEQVDQFVKGGQLSLQDVSGAGSYWKAEMERQTAQTELDKKRGYDKDGRPIAKDFESITNPDGTLQDTYKMKDWNNVTANTGALEKLRTDAMRNPGEMSAFGKLQMQNQDMEQAGQMDMAARQGAVSNVAAQSQLAQSGGLSGAARERMARTSSRDSLLNNQNIQKQGMMSRMGIRSNDEQSRTGALEKLQSMDNTQADIAFKNQQAQKTVDQQNVGNALDQVTQKRGWDANKYSDGMKEWGAGKTADAQARAARSQSSGGGGCCFIFLEARYGNGTMDKVVRRFRDEHMTAQNQRGYYKLSEVLVPLMRKSKLVKGLVVALMTTPLVAYGKAYYDEGSKLGFIFKPLTHFWLKTFEYLGGEHEFIRENGETI